MTARSFAGAEVRVLGTAAATISTATTTSLDFGSPNDLLLTPLLRGGDRVLVIFEAAAQAATQAQVTAIDALLDDLDALIVVADAEVGAPDFTDITTAMTGLHSAVQAVTISTVGSTDTVSFVVQDAPDSSGSIGTPATATTDGTLTGGTGNQYAVTGVKLQSDRPWLRLRATSDGTTDTFNVRATVLAIPGSF